MSALLRRRCCPMCCRVAQVTRKCRNATHAVSLPGLHTALARMECHREQKNTPNPDCSHTPEWRHATLSDRQARRPCRMAAWHAGWRSACSAPGRAGRNWKTHAAMGLAADGSGALARSGTRGRKGSVGTYADGDIYSVAVMERLECACRTAGCGGTELAWRGAGRSLRYKTSQN